MMSNILSNFHFFPIKIGDSVAITMITFAAAIVLSLAIELPIITLEKIIFPHRGSGTRPQVVIPVANGGSIQTGSQSSSNTSGSVSTDLEYAVAREDDQSVAKY